MTTHSSILAWKIPWTEESGRIYIYSPFGHKELDMTESLSNNKEKFCNILISQPPPSTNSFSSTLGGASHTVILPC